MFEEVKIYPFSASHSPFFFIFSWNFGSSRYHSLRFHHYHAHEVMAKTHEHALHPYPWMGRDEDITTMEYCLYDRILSFTPWSFPCHSHVMADAFHR